MKETITQWRFVLSFDERNRGGAFSREGRALLFDWFEELEADTGEEIELDVIAICCDFAESTLDEINQDYDQAFEDMDEAVDWLNDQTSVVGVTSYDTVVYQQF